MKKIYTILGLVVLMLLILSVSFIIIPKCVWAIVIVNIVIYILSFYIIIYKILKDLEKI